MMKIMKVNFKWNLVSRPLLWMYRRRWVCRNVPYFSLLIGFVLGGLIAVTLHGWVILF
jgi:hypothetical protein